MELPELSIQQAHELLLRGEISSEELTRAHLERIRRVDSQLRSYVTVTEDLAFEQAREAGPLPDVAVADAGYGVDTGFRDRLTELGLRYVVGVTGTVSLWPEGEAPLPPKRWSGRGRRPKLLRRDEVGFVTTIWAP